MPHAHDALPKTPANYAPLTPTAFLRKAAAAHPDHPAIVYGALRRTWAETADRCRRLASALVAAGLGPGETVSVMAANTPELYEAHFGVPLAGGVLNALNTRLDARTLAYILDHAETRILITDREFSPAIRAALAEAKTRPVVIDIDDPAAAGGDLLGAIDYEAFLATGDPAFPWRAPADEWDAIAINYTSGTTGDPKGVVYHHRGAYLNAVGNTARMGPRDASVYLWTLPMFHCNGWCFPWTVAAGRDPRLPAQGHRQGDLRRHRRRRRRPSLRRADRARLHDQCARGRPRTLPAARQRHDRRRTAAAVGAAGDGRARLRRHPRLRPDRSLRPRRRLRLEPRTGTRCR